MNPETIATHLRELSPKKRVPPSDALSEVRRRFMEKYGYWPSSLSEFDSEIDEFQGAEMKKARLTPSKSQLSEVKATSEIAIYESN